MTKKTKVLLAGGVVLCAVVAVAIDLLLVGTGRMQSTNDAYVTADFSIVAPKVGGLIDRVDVMDNQHVRAGQEIAHIEDSDYVAAVEEAEAALAAARAKFDNMSASLTRQHSTIAQQDAAVRVDDAALTFSHANAARYHKLAAGGAGTVEQQQQSAAQSAQASATWDRDAAAATGARQELSVLEAQRGEAVAGVKRAAASLRLAKLNLSYTHVLAPVDGVIGQRSVRVGNFVSPGSSLAAVVPIQAAYVLANFQETQLTHAARGQKVRIDVDTFPGQPLRGTVDSLAPATGVAFSPIPPDNATGNFTKVVQRIPLKILLDPGQTLAQRLRVGMSVEVRLDTSAHRVTLAANTGAGR
jgi:membrane fusion protein (multidrug efflux system)